MQYQAGRKGMRKGKSRGKPVCVFGSGSPHRWSKKPLCALFFVLCRDVCDVHVCGIICLEPRHRGHLLPAHQTTRVMTTSTGVKRKKERERERVCVCVRKARFPPPTHTHTHTHKEENPRTLLACDRSPRRRACRWRLWHRC